MNSEYCTTIINIECQQIVLLAVVFTGELLEEKKTDKERQRTSYHDDVMEVLSAKKIREYLK